MVQSHLGTEKKRKGGIGQNGSLIFCIRISRDDGDRARDISHTPYESTGMMESDQMRVMTPLELWLVRSDSNYRELI